MIEKKILLPSSVFAEGIALLPNGELYQITWKEEKAYIYREDDLGKIGQKLYKGEGWGLCCDGEFFYMSDGTNHITVRDPSTFEILKKFKVYCGREGCSSLNDLECVGNSIYANIWPENYLIKFNKKNGRIEAIIDASSLKARMPSFKEQEENVLNGIAYHAAHHTFILTGKNWPSMFEVIFVPVKKVKNLRSYLQKK